MTLNSTQDQKTQNISLCNWTFNSTAAHDFAKFSALKALNTTKNFDFICLLECYLDSTILSDNKSLCLDGYKLIRPKTSGRVEFVFIIGKHYRLVKIIQLNYLPECLVCEINYDNNNFHRYFVRSPSQSNKDFDEFLRGFEGVIDNINQCSPYFTLITGDFNARCNNSGKMTVTTLKELALISYFILRLKATNCRTNSNSSYFNPMH